MKIKISYIVYVVIATIVAGLSILQIFLKPYTLRPSFHTWD